MKENSYNYSDSWQPYIGDYDKFEYDIKLKDGTIVENCYPNAGEFNSISKEHDGESFNESEIEEIRFSQEPIYCINDGVSEVDQDYYYNKMLNEPMITESTNNEPSYVDYKDQPLVDNFPRRTQPIVKDAKIHRNDPCVCGSGKKYKKCCLNK